MEIESIAKKVKEASVVLMSKETELKNKALLAIKDELKKNSEKIFNANQKDLKKSREDNISEPLYKRLLFDEKKLESVLDGIDSLIDLKDPTGEVLMETELDKGLDLYKVSCPIGVIGVIFESRPDALVQISTLCLKSGNGVLLKGGREASNTNRILFELINKASIKAKMPKNWIKLFETRQDVKNMLKCDQSIDLIIPRGSNEFVRYIMDNSNIPVLGHADGICHCYVDNEVDFDKAAKVVYDSKTQYVAVCNALETLLINEDIADEFLPLIQKKLSQKSVLIHGCPKTSKIIKCDYPNEENYKREYLDYEISIRVVKNLDEAIDHINQYGSGHTDSILTKNEEKAQIFLNRVDSGNVFVNCSTRFSDGYRYGFGAEVGISTNKIHARGPVGLEGLLIYKYKLIGNNNVVEDYSSGAKTFKHIRKK